MKEIDGSNYSEEFRAELGEYIKSSLEFYDKLSRKYNIPLSEILVYTASGTVFMASLAEESETEDPSRLYIE